MKIKSSSVTNKYVPIETLHPGLIVVLEDGDYAMTIYSFPSRTDKKICGVRIEKGTWVSSTELVKIFKDELTISNEGN